MTHADVGRRRGPKSTGAKSRGQGPQKRRPEIRLPRAERVVQYEQAIPKIRAADALSDAVLSSTKAGLRLSGKVVGRVACNVLFLSLLGWGLIWFFTSNRFYVSRIVVVGNRHVSMDVVQEASGLHGYSVFWINPRQVASNIMGSLPPITQVKVRYGLDNVVTLIVQEQEEQIIWEAAGQRYWVDDGGHLHPAYGEDEPGLLIKDIRPGPPDRVDAEVLIAASQIIRLLPELQVIEYAPITGLRLRHGRGWLVYLGTGNDMARKVSVLRAMEVQFAGEDVVQPTLIDLRFPDSPYYRLAADADVAPTGPRPEGGN